jgi:serine/threonine-protein kinase
VLDFGIAKLRDDSRATQQAMTQAGDMLGTPQYMAPEQIKGEAIDGRTDVYALGCMLYEMVTARLPFEGPTVMALLSKHLIEAVVPPSQRRPDLMIPPAVEQLILSAMAKDPGARPPSMEVFGEQIAALLATMPSDPAYPSSAGPLSMQAPVVAPSFVPPAPAPMYTPQVASFAPPAPSAPAFPPPPGVVLPAPPAPPVASSGGGKGLLIVLALLVLGGGGFAVYWFALRTPKATTHGTAVTDPDDHGSDTAPDVPETSPDTPVTPTPVTPVSPDKDPWGGGGSTR